MSLRHPIASFVDRAVAWRSKRHFPQYLAEFRAMERWDPERLQAWRFKRMQSLIEHAYKTVPYWTEQLDRLSAKPEDFTAPEHVRLLPALTKDLINQQGDALLSRESARGRISFNSTGGSTGKNVWFLLDTETQDRRRAAGRLTEEWDGIEPGTRMATLWGASLDAKPSRAARWYDKLTNKLFLSAYGVGLDKVGEYYAALARFKPAAISAYPSLLLHFARQVGKSRCRALGFRVIYTSAEALYEPVREELQEYFGAAVRNRYASREFGMIASDCPQGGGLHLMDMRLWVETIPPHSIETPGELVISDLDNYPMPMIRYRIEDTGRFSVGPCACGRSWTKLTAVDGRVLDVIVTPDGRAFGGTFFTLTLRPFDRSVAQFQVIQERVDHLTVKIVPGQSWDLRKRAEILETLNRQLGGGLQIDLIEVGEISPLTSGKRRFVVSQIDPAQRVTPV
jgi:phenylacetate-CoA ligase